MKFLVTIDDPMDRIGWQPHETALKLFELAAPFWGDHGLMVTTVERPEPTVVESIRHRTPRAARGHNAGRVL